MTVWLPSSAPEGIYVLLQLFLQCNPVAHPPRPGMLTSAALAGQCFFLSPSLLKLHLHGYMDTIFLSVPEGLHRHLVQEDLFSNF